MLYFDIAFLLYWVHNSFVDAKMYDYRKTVPLWIKSDWMYLGGRLVTTLALLFSLQSASPIAFWVFLKHIMYCTLIGSVVWDWVYGYLDHLDPLYPFADWFNGWGFESRGQRIAFDLIRILLALPFIVL